MRLNRIWQQKCWKTLFEIDIFEKHTLSCRFQMSWSRCNRIEISPGFKFRVQKLTLCITTNWRLFSAKYCCIGCSQRPPLIFRPKMKNFCFFSKLRRFFHPIRESSIIDPEKQVGFHRFYEMSFPWVILDICENFEIFCIGSSRGRAFCIG